MCCARANIGAANVAGVSKDAFDGELLHGISPAPASKAYGKNSATSIVSEKSLCIET